MPCDGAVGGQAQPDAVGGERLRAVRSGSQRGDDPLHLDARVRRAGDVNAQPAIGNVSVASTIGAPPSVTCAFAGTALTVPPCGHISVLLLVR